jgi:predicted alpha-1,6-mannanase (GH76 family)
MSDLNAKMSFPGPEYYRSIAINAVEDLMRHFWTGDADDGHVIPTWDGYAKPQLPDPRGSMWERAMMMFALENLYRLTRDDAIGQRINAEWQHDKAVYTADELEAAGTQIHLACDDCGWDAWLYLIIHRTIGDPYALERAIGMTNNAFGRWLNDDLGGGMWYSDKKQYKSSYQASNVLGALRIFDLTGDEWFYQRAMNCYQWMELNLLRPDGMYWCDYGVDGPSGRDREPQVQEAGSSTFLCGNMMMGIIHAWLYRKTSEDEFLQRAVRTAEAILKGENDGHGSYLNDRDAWTDGAFAGEWAMEVLTLPGMNKACRDQLRTTADSIYRNARTPDGFYSGSWSGPADGPGSRWSSKGSRPEQINTSSSSVNIIVAAALDSQNE